MGVRKSPYFLQKKILELFEGFDTVRAYIDEELVITKNKY